MNDVSSNSSNKRVWNMSIGFTLMNGYESRIDAKLTGVFSYIGQFLTAVFIVITALIAVITYPLAWVLVKTHLIPPNSDGKVMSFKFEGE